MNTKSFAAAPTGWARAAGLLWLATIALGIFAEGLVRGRLITEDPATTISNIFANEGLYRLGEASLFIGTATYLALTAIMYRLLAPVDRTVSLIAALFSTAGCVIWILSLVGDAAPFALLQNGQGPETLRSLAFGLLQLHGEGLILGMLCFGVQCLLLGSLVVRAPFLPAIIGFILALGGACYGVAGLLHILSPPLSAQFGRLLFMPGEAGEALMGLWLTVFSINASKWNAFPAQPA